MWQMKAGEGEKKKTLKEHPWYLKLFTYIQMDWFKIDEKAKALAHP